jgi:hypothetical protein
VVYSLNLADEHTHLMDEQVHAINMNRYAESLPLRRQRTVRAVVRLFNVVRVINYFEG